jgi:hypothetical protein
MREIKKSLPRADEPKPGSVQEERRRLIESVSVLSPVEGLARVGE